MLCVIGPITVPVIAASAAAVVVFVVVGVVVIVVVGLMGRRKGTMGQTSRSQIAMQTHIGMRKMGAVMQRRYIIM